MRTTRPPYPRLTFRSKLEAQWSVIFDQLGLPWAFEPVVFDLPSGKYIPDFKIYPEVNDPRTFWVEIKGPWPNAREFEVATEVNIYAETPLVILSGDVPKQENGGTAWWFNPARGDDDFGWSMLRTEEALCRVLYRDGHVPEEWRELWRDALRALPYAEINPVVDR